MTAFVHYDNGTGAIVQYQDHSQLFARDGYEVAVVSGEDYALLVAAPHAYIVDLGSVADSGLGYDTADLVANPSPPVEQPNLTPIPYTAVLKCLDINGNFVFSQEHGTNEITGIEFGTNTPFAYPADAHFVTHGNPSAGICKAQLVADAPDGFVRSIKVTVTTTTTSADRDISVGTIVPGDRMAELNFGTSAARAFSYIQAFKPSVAMRMYLQWKSKPEPGGNYRVITQVHDLVANEWNWVDGTLPGDTGGTWYVGEHDAGLVYSAYMTRGSFTAHDNHGEWYDVAGGGGTAYSDQTNLFATNGAIFQYGPLMFVGHSAPPTQQQLIADRRGAGEELALCRRQFQKSFSVHTIPQQNLSYDTGEHTGVLPIGVFAGAIAVGRIPLLVPLASSFVGGGISFYNPVASNVQARNRTKSVDFTSTVMVASSNTEVVFEATIPATSSVGDRLSVHWVANARISIPTY